MHASSLLVGLAALYGAAAQYGPAHISRDRKVCEVAASGTNATDDAPAILAAFDECGQGGTVLFTENTTYYVNSVMEVSGLQDCHVDIRGTLLWSTDIQYWLNNSLPVGYQNQSTAFKLGGDRVLIDGHGHGTFDGNGGVWYHYAAGISNLKGRPHALTLDGLNNSRVTGLQMLRSQMWTFSIIRSHYSLFDNIFVNNTALDGSSSANTDGGDTFFSSHLTFRNWTVVSKDDSISFKANSTDITVTDSLFINGLGIAIGSIGQYKDQFETIERIKADNITFKNTLHAAYFKTWTGEQVGYPPNGGGGGLGYATNLSFTNLYGTSFRGAPFSISQCTTFSGTAGNCTSSKFELENIEFANFDGTAPSLKLASLQCSGVAPCHDITIRNVTLASNGETSPLSYLCGNVVDPIGWNCTGDACVGGSATGQC
ncbi:Alpha-L-rhamnosidase rgxB [Pestalotiopsis fici W106-1]|uniref:Alpha-L-rhamnosidase rgxB n=1 Tax=Pestalotiopsis fici (strain W106-1 / CGMCC3.15140) TaxID=1229662 RepID=W3WJH9_PESFW|nr:Alpha-L-rhamnosidase rgxB [Pestalotiopsis fici W106-1]ETS74085.1 Alpha-L-rhamnosidase rgxB [Pestalotiopsis fici W106-1]